jgi:hypothetical protein
MPAHPRRSRASEASWEAGFRRLRPLWAIAVSMNHDEPGDVERRTGSRRYRPRSGPTIWRVRLGVSAPNAQPDARPGEAVRRPRHLESMGRRRRHRRQPPRRRRGHAAQRHRSARQPLSSGNASAGVRHSARRSLAVNPARKPSRWSGFSFAITSSRHSRRTGHTAHSPRVNCVFARPLPRTGYHHSSGVPRHSASSIHEVMNERSHPGYADGIPAQESDTSP